ERSGEARGEVPPIPSRRRDGTSQPIARDARAGGAAPPQLAGVHRRESRKDLPVHDADGTRASLGLVVSVASTRLEAVRRAATLRYASSHIWRTAGHVQGLHVANAVRASPRASSGWPGGWRTCAAG